MNEDNFPKTYYFTFGISGNHAFNGGWVKVIATGKASAIQTFLKAYPRAAGSMTLHIADIYTAEEFANTGMLEKGFSRGRSFSEIERLVNEQEVREAEEARQLSLFDFI